MVSTLVAGSIVWLVYWYKNTQFNELKKTWWLAHEAVDELKAQNIYLTEELDALIGHYKLLESKYRELVNIDETDL